MKQQLPESWLAVIQEATQLFEKKLEIDGTQWSYLRPRSVVDWLYVKTQEIIRQLKTEKNTAVYATSNIGEKLGNLLNMAIIGLIQQSNSQGEYVKLIPTETAVAIYKQKINAFNNTTIELSSNFEPSDIILVCEMIHERLRRISKDYSEKRIDDHNEATLLPPRINGIISKIILAKTLFNKNV